MYRWFPSILKIVTIVQPETLVRWHRAGFRRHWRWKSRSRGGGPQIDLELRTLIRQMRMENLLLGRAAHSRLGGAKLAYVRHLRLLRSPLPGRRPGQGEGGQVLFPKDGR